MSNTKHIVDNLSAYLDGRLSEGDRAQLEAHLRTCPSCQSELHSLQYAVAMTRSLPKMHAPRSFTLSPEMAARARPHGQFGWIYDALRGFTALAAVLLVLVCSADFLSLNRSAGFGPAASAPAVLNVPGSTQAASGATDQVQNQPKSSATLAGGSEPPAGALAAAPTPVPPAGVSTSAPAPVGAAQSSPTRATQAPRAADAATSAPGTTARGAVVSPAASAVVTPSSSLEPAATPSLALTVTVKLIPTLPATVAPPPPAGFLDTSSFRVAEIGLLGALILGVLATLVLRSARR